MARDKGLAALIAFLDALQRWSQAALAAAMGTDQTPERRVTNFLWRCPGGRTRP